MKAKKDILLYGNNKHNLEINEVLIIKAKYKLVVYLH
jgi:hypothetical protein